MSDPDVLPGAEWTLAFESDIKSLERRYRHIRGDVENALKELVFWTTLRPIPGYSFQALKGRVASSDIAGGKSAGFRVILFRNDPFYLGAIYAKPKKSILTNDEIRGRFRRVIEETRSRR